MWEHLSIQYPYMIVQEMDFTVVQRVINVVESMHETISKTSICLCIVNVNTPNERFYCKIMVSH